MAPIKVEVTMDTVCPYCYLGKRNLDTAIEAHRKVHPDDEFEISWKPFYLNPTARKQGYTRMEVFQRKFGARTPDFVAHIADLGRPHGIVFDLTGRTGASRDSHKLIAAAGARRGHGAQSALVERLLRGHNEEGGDVADRGFLVAAAADVGIAPDEAAAWLDDEAVGGEVDRLAWAAAEERRLKAVPVFTIQGRYVVGGFQEADVFLPVFEKAHALAVTEAAAA